MTNKEFILEILRLIRPKFYNKLTWFIVGPGLILISPPLITTLLHIVIKEITEYNLIGEDDKYWGLLLILIGLLFNVISQIITGKSSINFNLVFARNGNVTINQNTFIITDEEKAKEIIKTLSKSNQNFSQNYTQSEFVTKFQELFKALPWVKGISLVTIQSGIEIFKIDYESSDNSIKHFNIHVLTTSDTHIEIPNNSKQEQTPIALITYWSKIGYWTINSMDICRNDKISLESAIKNDISNILGDLTYIIDNLQIRLTYDNNHDDKAIRHPDYGYLRKVEVYKDENYSELNFLEMGLIDSNIDMQAVQVDKTGEITTVIEKVSYTHIFKISTLMIRFLSMSGLEYNINNTLTIRKSIIEFMKTISAIKSYAIPELKTEQTRLLFKDAFENTWVYKRFENRK